MFNLSIGGLWVPPAHEPWRKIRSGHRSHQEGPDERHSPEEVHQHANVWATSNHKRLFWHDKSIKELIEYFDSTWIMEEKVLNEEIGKCCVNRKLDIEVDSALHMVIGSFLGEKSKMLADTAEVHNLQNLEMHKSGLELRRLLQYNLTDKT